MKNIQNHIKDNTIKNCYLLFGEEVFLVRHCKKLLKQAIVGEDTMNLSIYSGKDISLSELRDNAQTMPFWAEKKLIIVTDSGFCKSASEEITAIVKNAPETTYFIFAESEVDKRNKLYKTIADKGYAAEMKFLSDNELAKWCAVLVKDAGKKILESVMKAFIMRTGPSMDNVGNEMKKVLSYIGDKETVDLPDIEAVCSVNIEDRIFDMIDAIGSKNREKAMKYYTDLLLLKEAPMKMLVLLTRHINTLLGVRTLTDEGMSSSEISAKLGIRGFFLNKYVSQAKCFSRETLRQAFEDCVKADEDIKTGQVEDKYAVEMIIVKYSR